MSERTAEKMNKFIENSNNGMFDDNHPTVELPYKGGTVDIDVLIAPLIQQMWNQNIDTMYCCQGNSQKVTKVYPDTGIETTSPLNSSISLSYDNTIKFFNCYPHASEYLSIHAVVNGEYKITNVSEVVNNPDDYKNAVILVGFPQECINTILKA